MKHVPKQRPDFADPPLDEVVCGIQFADTGWTEIEYGRYFDTVLGGQKGKFKLASRQPLLPQIASDFQGVTFDLVGTAARLWFEETDSPYLIQVQPCRFLLNWRRLAKTYEYPRFFPTTENPKGTIWERFETEAKAFAGFIAAKDGKPAQPVGLELTYVNHFVQGDDWKEIKDLAGRFVPLKGVEHLPSLTAFGFSAVYKVQDVSMRLQVRRATRNKDQKQLCVVEFDVKAKVAPDIDLEKWFIDANYAITSEFARLTTQNAQERWGRKS